jgi:hypothetical protein
MEPLATSQPILRTNAAMSTNDSDLKSDLALTFAEKLASASSLKTLRESFVEKVYFDVLDNWTLDELEEELRILREEEEGVDG